MDFDIVIPLQTPFLYDPALGHLLFEWKNHSHETSGSALDAVNAADSVSRIVNSTGDSEAPSGAASSHGLITKFTFVASIASPPRDSLLGSAPEDFTLLAVDPTDGTGTLIGTISNPAPAIPGTDARMRATGLATDPTTSVVYALGETAHADFALVTVDTRFARSSFVSHFPAASVFGIGGADFDSSGQLWASVTAGMGAPLFEALAKIDKTNASTVPIGTGFGPIGIDGIAFDLSDTLWAVSTDTDMLYQVDTTTGVASGGELLLDGLGFPPPAGGFTSLQFTCDGTLYAGIGESVSPGSDGGELFTIDTTTGVFTAVDSISATGGASLGGLALVTTCSTSITDSPTPTGTDIPVVSVETFEQVAAEVTTRGTTTANFCVGPDTREIEQRNGRFRYISRPLRLMEFSGRGTCTGRLVPDDPTNLETWEDLLTHVDLEIAPWYRSYQGTVRMPDDEPTLPDGSDPVGHWFVLAVVRSTDVVFEGTVVSVPFPEALIDYTGFFNPTEPEACEAADLSLRPLDLGGAVEELGDVPNLEASRMLVDTGQCDRSYSLTRRTTHVYQVRLDGNARVERINVQWQLNGIEDTLLQISGSPGHPGGAVSDMQDELSTARDAFAEGRWDAAIFDLEQLACIANSTDFSGIADSEPANYSGALVSRSIAGAFAIHDRHLHADPSDPGWDIYFVPDGLMLPVLQSATKTSCLLP